ncbi:ADP-ribosylglycohydrolase family protein [Piscicoccus intestinalis]|uniref:ADP-ribosylglycohydrolase family protein n=1 Tax=Piscicoccus intestinalis TaxID=746033 RepID=UPI001C3F3D7E
MLAGAVGDALGASIEFDSWGTIRARFGERGLTGYAPAYGRSGGAITDDTQMTLFTADGLIRAVNRWEGKGVCSARHVVHHAYLCWLATQGTIPRGPEHDGWLIEVPRGIRACRRCAPGRSAVSMSRSMIRRAAGVSCARRRRVWSPSMPIGSDSVAMSPP